MLGDLKTYLAIEVSQNKALLHGKLQRIKTPRSDMQITPESCRPMTSKNLPEHDLTVLLNLKFLLITQHEVQPRSQSLFPGLGKREKALGTSLHEVPFINMSEATKRSNDPTENGKCTNVTDRRSRVG